MLSFSSFYCLTFDCYGTLIDWESGMLTALRPMLARHSIEITDAHLLELYGELEPAEQQRSYRSYREVLQGVVVGLGDRLGFRPTLEDLNCLSVSLPSWQPFPDTVASLAQLKKRFQLAIISNIDDDLFAFSALLLKVPFDWVITAQQAKCYKPGLPIFRLALKRTGLASQQVLHCGQSPYHDVIPAQSLGMSTVWVKRPSRREGFGATKAVQAAPNLTVTSLAELAQLADCESGSG